jgi:eukaryotic-like serine/threonine-protein kinase
MGTSDEARVLAGSCLLGPCIDRGGTASVHLGRMLGAAGFHRLVAVKRLLAVPRSSTAELDADANVRLAREASIVGRVPHTNVVPVRDVLVDRGELFVVMDYVEGVSLASLLFTHAVTIPPPIASFVIAGVLDGLGAVHAAEVAHRDISPENLLVGTDGVGRLIDFGIARTNTHVTMTALGIIRGKLPYLPPEVLAGELHGPAGDIYACGVILWEALVGRRLFAAATDEALIEKVLVGEIPPPSQLVPALDHSVDDVVLTALEHNPRRRFAQAKDMARALRLAIPPSQVVEIVDWLESALGPLLAERRQRAAAFEQSPVPSLEASVSTERRRPRPQRIRWPLVTVAVLLCLVTVGVISVRRGPPASSAPTAQGDRRGAAEPKSDDRGPTAVPPRSEVEPAPGSLRPAALPSPSKPRPTAPHAATPVRPKVDCTVPYVVDGQGLRTYRRECLP